MLEIGRTYPKPELSLIFNTRDKQGLDRKLTRYGIVFDVCGRGERATYGFWNTSVLECHQCVFGHIKQACRNPVVLE
jgi:hypothetical protein